MGSQWAGMVEGLLQLEVISKVVNMAASILKPLGLDLLSILNTKDERTFDNVLYSSVSITCMQVIFRYFKLKWSYIDNFKHICKIISRWLWLIY